MLPALLILWTVRTCALSTSLGPWVNPAPLCLVLLLGVNPGLFTLVGGGEHTFQPSSVSVSRPAPRQLLAHALMQSLGDTSGSRGSRLSLDSSEGLVQLFSTALAIACQGPASPG